MSYFSVQSSIFKSLYNDESFIPLEYLIELTKDSIAKTGRTISINNHRKHEWFNFMKWAHMGKTWRQIRRRLMANNLKKTQQYYDMNRRLDGRLQHSPVITLRSWGPRFEFTLYNKVLHIALQRIRIISRTLSRSIKKIKQYNTPS